MPPHEMTDAEVAAEVERTDAFVANLRDAIAEAIAAVNPHSPCADASRRGLARISATLGAVPFVTMYNLANIDAALKRRTGSGLMSFVRVRLMSVGGGPSLDFESATDFFAPFTDIVEKVRRRRIN